MATIATTSSQPNENPPEGNIVDQLKKFMADPYNINMITKFLKVNQVELPKEGVRPPPDSYVSTPTRSNQLPTFGAAYGMSSNPTTSVQLGVPTP